MYKEGIYVCLLPKCIHFWTLCAERGPRSNDILILMHLVPRSLNIILQYKPGVHEEITDFRAETWQIKINLEHMFCVRKRGGSWRMRKHIKRALSQPERLSLVKSGQSEHQINNGSNNYNPLNKNLRAHDDIIK